MIDVKPLLKRLLAKWRRSSANLRKHGWAGAALARENDVEDVEKLLKAAEPATPQTARSAKPTTRRGATGR